LVEEQIVFLFTGEEIDFKSIKDFTIKTIFNGCGTPRILWLFLKKSWLAVIFQLLGSHKSTD